MNPVEIEIDGQKLEVAPGSMIIEAADAAGIRIPRFCYHKKLSVAANCRTCLVEVEKVGKPLPACATPVTPGMKVFTQSPKAIDAQKSVMEFLLINHPLDCPICDQGGACELQDVSMGYGADISRYTEGKRSVKDENLGSLISTEMTRCIQCTRCIRFGQEIAGLQELGTIGRGDRMEVGSYLKSRAMESELSGNVIDLCPVGALTSKPFRFTARSWELNQHSSIAPHDNVGSNLYIHTRRGKVMRVIPKENESINESWLSDRDRFSYQALDSDDRLTVPLIKENGEWQETDWSTALNFAVKQLKIVKEQKGAHEIAGLISPNATLEELYLFQKLLRGLGTPHIDHRLRQTNVSDQSQMPLMPLLGVSIEALQEQETILLIGSNVRHEQPLISQRLRKAALKGAAILAVNPVDFDFNFSLKAKSIVAPHEMLKVLDQIAEGDLFSNELNQGKKKIILLGALAWNHPEAANIRAYAQYIAERYQMTIGYLTEGANATGAWLAGAVSHRAAAGENLNPIGHSANAAFQEKLQAYLLFQFEPDQDCVNPSVAMASLESAESVIAFSTHRSASLLSVANVILPIAPYAETSGTYVNIEGRWQNFAAATAPQGESRPGWKILRVLGNLLQLSGFDYTSSEEVRDEVKNLIDHMPTRAPLKFSAPKPLVASEMIGKLQRITEWPIYRSDMLVRRGIALQASALAEKMLPCARLNEKTAQKKCLITGQSVLVKQGNLSSLLSWAIDNRLPDDCVAIAAGFSETAELGAPFGAIEIDHGVGRSDA